MRDKKRISLVLKELERLWIENPDLRLCQLIANCFDKTDLYYIEDDVFLKCLIKEYHG